MKHRLNILAIVSMLTLLPLSVLAEGTNALETLQQYFLKQEQTLVDGYGTALGSLMAESKKKGDMDLYLVVEAEQKRFETEKTIPTLADVNVAFKAPVESYYKQRVGIFKKQVSALDALMKSEMQADHMESAKALKAEKDKVAFELADLEAKLPKLLDDQPRSSTGKSSQKDYVRDDGVPGEAASAEQSTKTFPQISGVWQEAPDIFLTITQNKGTWKARCSYTRPKIGEVRWEMRGTITAAGRLRGTLQHTKAPASWKRPQVREGTLSDDGNTISGTAIWDNSGHDFTWTRKMERGMP